jgi:hypothetical protein
MATDVSWWDIWGFLGDVDSSRGHVGCDPEDGGSKALRNVGILPRHNTQYHNSTCLIRYC